MINSGNIDMPIKNPTNKSIQVEMDDATIHAFQTNVIYH